MRMERRVVVEVEEKMGMMREIGVFVFKEEDGIRVMGVTEVQACALPIYYKGYYWAK